MDKLKILDVVKTKVTDKIRKLENLIEETRASNNDTKSSMGDKYETGREMLQQEINNLQVQLNEVLKQQNFLNTILPKSCEKTEKGAVVKTEKGLFFISVSLGEIIVEGRKIICISPESPLAKAMNGLTENQFFFVNNLTQKIVEIR
ncbi:hypothetical protein [uncultured Chryseobacterium sp.]|uniref:hypothetical protein n=1 Tax=uncultured Chryseobacterium sp. TaxID=259322 RepID=UPI0025E06B57|nr:hypothetical protein [uncultured Chryseobacterium sp.]